MQARISSPVDETGTFPASRLVNDFRLVTQRAGQRARESAKAANRVLRDHPYQTLGIALGLGLVIGALARRRWIARG